MTPINLAVGYPAIAALSALNHRPVAGLAAHDFSTPGPFAGIAELREAIVQRQVERHGLHWSADELIVTNGATEAIALPLQNLLRAGEEVLLPLPSWNHFGQLMDWENIRYRTFDTSAATQFQPTAAQLAEEIKPRTRLLVLTNPGNPGGGVLGRAEMEAIAELVRAHPRLLVVADEVYELQAFGRPFVSFASLPGMANRTITLHGFSKSFGLTAWRVGWLHVPSEHYEDLLYRHRLLTYGVPPAGQYVALAALRAESEYRALWADYIPGNQAFLAGALNQVDGITASVPPGAYFVLADGRRLLHQRRQTPSAFTQQLQAAQQLQIRDASEEGLPGWFRINAAQERSVLEAAVQRLWSYVEDSVDPPDQRDL